jgi:hypothetical protein
MGIANGDHHWHCTIGEKPGCTIDVIGYITNGTNGSPLAPFLLPLVQMTRIPILFDPFV